MTDETRPLTESAVPTSGTRLWFAVWTLVIVASLSIFLGSSALTDPDEGRNAEVGREMALTNNYVLPHMNGLPYLDKPIVYFAAEAALMEVLGPTETAARLPALLFTLATIALIAWFAKRTIGGGSPLVAAIVLASCPLVIAFARIVIFDSALGFFVALSTIGFYFAIERKRAGQPWRAWNALAWASIGAGILTKGPVAILLPLLVAIPYGFYRKGARAIFSILGIILTAAIVAPWVWAVSQTLPDFMHYVVYTETLSRLTSNELKRNAPPWYFLPYIIGGAFPWIVLLPFQLRRETMRNGEGKLDPRFVFAAIWLVLPFVFFSLSHSKRPQYLVPLMPAVALLAAFAYEKCQGRIRGTRILAIAVALLGLGLAGAIASGAHIKSVPPQFHAAATHAVVLFALICVVTGVVAAIRANYTAAALGILALVPLSIPLTLRPIIDSAAEQRSARQLATSIAPYAEKGAEIASIESFRPSLTFYLRQPVLLASQNAEEMTSNYILRKYDRYITAPDTPLRTVQWFTDRLARCEQPTVFVFDGKIAEVREPVLGAALPLAGRSGKFVAYGPCRAAQGMR